MILPDDPVRRLAAVLNLIQDCGVSQTRRIVSYENRMRWYLYGAVNGVAEDNKIKSGVDMLSSFLYTGESTFFSLDLTADADEKDLRRVTSFEEQINKVWHDCNIDNFFGEGVTRAITYDSMFLRLVPKRNDLTAYLCEPGSMGFLREDVYGMDRQEAFTHRYYITVTELYKHLAGLSNARELIDRMSKSANRGQKQDAGPIRAWATAVPSSDTGTLTGNVTSVESPDEYLPEVRVPQVRIYELFLKDDKLLEDYRMVRVADPDIILYDGPAPFLPHQHPFIQICPEMLYSYAWGMSLISFIRKTQDWNNDEIWNIRNIMEQQFDPPRAFMGFDMMDEAQYALSVAGSSVQSRNPSAKVQDFRPPMPPDIWAVRNGIAGIMNDQTGMSGLMQGKEGGKNAPHAQMLASLGAARLKRMSGQIEDALDQIATKIFLCVRAYWTDDFVAEKEDGSADHYQPSEFTDDAVVHVDGHSQSAVFNAEMKDDADKLMKEKAIDRRTYIEMLNPPNKAVLLRRLKDIQKHEAEAETAKQQHELQLAQSKRR